MDQQRELSGEAPRQLPPRDRRGRMVAVGLIALLFGAMAAGAYLFERLGSSDSPSRSASSAPEPREGTPEPAGTGGGVGTSGTPQAPSEVERDAASAQTAGDAVDRGNPANSGNPANPDNLGNPGNPGNPVNPRQNDTVARRAEPADEPRAPEPPAKSASVAGPWTLETMVASSSMAAFEGLRLEYRVDLQQNGNAVRGTGRKVRENDKLLGGSARTPITVEGTLEGDRLTLTFTERGAQRASGGTMTLTRHAIGLMRGRFSSDAARSAGSAVAWR